MRTAIYGAGSLGTVLGAYLTKAGMQVDLISRNRAHIEALRKHGARIVGKQELTVPVNALHYENMEGTYDYILLLTKQLENDKVSSFLAPFLGETGVLCTLQNGLPEPALMEKLGPGRVCGCTIGWGATLLEPGMVELTSETDALSFNLGMLPPVNHAMLTKLSDLLSIMGPVTIEENFLGARWSKLLINASFSGIATVLGCTFGEVVDNRQARRLAQQIMKECLDTAKTGGVVLQPVQGKDIARLFDFHGPVKRLISFSLIPLAMKKHRALKPSMLQDLEKGKPCEVDAINGVLSSQARKVGVPTPVNDQVVSLIHAIEQKQKSVGWQNLDAFP